MRANARQSKALIGTALLTVLDLGTVQAQQVEPSTSYHNTLYIGARYREGRLVSDKFADRGRAHTLRLQLGYLWAIDPHWALYVEGTKLWSLFGHQYDDTSGPPVGYPSEADPPSQQLTSAWFGYRNRLVEARLGRQYIRFDNERFFGSNSWRQTPQTFDGLSTRWHISAGTTVDYDYLSNDHRTVGDQFPELDLRRQHLQAHLFHASQQLPLGSLSAFVYLIRNNTAAANSVRTRGLNWSGDASPDHGRTQFSWTAMLARQNSYQNNPDHFDVGYHLFELNYGLPSLSGKLGEEHLGSNGRDTVNIAYGAVHPFDGWMAVFPPPLQGLRDRYVGVFGAIDRGRYSWQVTYHDFNATHVDLHYGHELDIGLKGKLSSRFSAEFQYAIYHADHYSFSQHKLWLILEYRYGTQTI